MNTCIRKLDEMNRVILPVEIRKQLGLKTGDTLSLTLAGDRIIVTPKTPCCPICKSALDNDQYGICCQCVELVINH